MLNRNGNDTSNQIRKSYSKRYHCLLGIRVDRRRAFEIDKDTCLLAAVVIIALKERRRNFALDYYRCGKKSSFKRNYDTSMPCAVAVKTWRFSYEIPGLDSWRDWVDSGLFQLD
jgi:hypothetical protein